jgi:hypothetical protein
MTKKETFKWVVQIIASIATAILTAMGTTSCRGIRQDKAFWSLFPERFDYNFAWSLHIMAFYVL